MRVVNCRREPYDVYIGRPSEWGNPFKAGRDGTREEVIEMYRSYLYSSGLIDRIDELKDKTLGCWCKPRACHGDVLVKILKERHESRIDWLG